MRVRAVLDTCVLYPSVLRDVLLRCAERDLFDPRWSSRILDELISALSRNRPDITPDRLRRLTHLMNVAFPDALVEGVHPTDAGLPDPADEHVVAALVVSSAQALVTFNTRHFPSKALSPLTYARVITPDAFLIELLRADQDAALSAVVSAADDMRRPPSTPAQVLQMLSRHAPSFAHTCRERLGDSP
jgi:predicted nucleic acid-binding protein